MSNTKSVSPGDRLGSFRRQEDGIHRVPGGETPSVVVLLRKQGGKLEVRSVEDGNPFYGEWVKQKGKRIHFPFNPPRAHHFPARMKGDERRLASAIQRYLLLAFEGSDLSEWTYPRPKDKRQSPAAPLSVVQM